ncbi:MAG: pseudaminic acid cytidylyltransferase, partial [Cytophagaceae bacterium]
MKTLCIIPARGGSKRIPRKNIRPFLGSPIIAYSIRAAQESGLFDEVMVSTDDAEIAQMAQLYGASVPFARSSDTSNDFATTAAVLTEVLDTYAQHGQHFDRACCLYATAPFVTADKLREAFG